MSSRYANSNYYPNSSYTSSYSASARTRSQKQSYYPKATSSSRQQYTYQAPATKGPKSKPQIRSGPSMMGLGGRRKPSGQWKAKKKAKEEKLGEHNPEVIEEELTKYKKGVFYFDGSSKKPDSNGHANKAKQYAQFQLTKTSAPPPKVYTEEDLLPPPVPPNYEERIKSQGVLNDDMKDPSVSKKGNGRKSKSSSSRRRKKKSNTNMVTLSPVRGSQRAAYNRPMPYDPGYGPESGAIAPGYWDPDNLYTGYKINQYGFLDPTYQALQQYGFLQDGTAWYPFPDTTNPPIAPNPGLSAKDPYATPKQSRRNRKNINSANVDLTTPLNAGKNGKKTNMSPGRRVNKIQKQLDFYLSVANMENDSFMKKLMDSEGWIMIDTILTFNKMKLLAATKELVIEAAFHSNIVEIEVKKQEKIRMTSNLWKPFVSQKKGKRSSKKSSSSAAKQQKLKDKQKEKELDAAELNKDTIESIVAGIQKKAEQRKKRQERKKKKEKKEEQQDKDNNKKSEEKKDSEEVAQKPEDLIKKDKKEGNDDGGDPDGNDMIEID